jgi:hypothetical protein
MTSINRVTGKDLLNSVKLDVKSFFSGRSQFELKIEYHGVNPTCCGVGSSCRIRMPAIFQELQICDAAELNFWLLTLGHEIAHYLNRHNDFNANTEESNLESRALEDWADFYGAKIMMTLITYGDRVKLLYTGFPENKGDDRFLHISQAFAKLANTFYVNSSSRYSPRMVRVGGGVAGIMSFIDRDIGYMNVWRSMSIMHKIYLSPSLKDLFSTEQMVFPNTVEPIVGIHKKIQGLAPAISEGLDPFLVKFIGTSYDGSEEDRRAYVQKMRREAQRQGLEIPQSPD